MSKLSRRSFLFACSATALAAVVPGAPAFAASPPGKVEATIEWALRQAALRQQFTPKETWDLATKLGVHLGKQAPRSSVWMRVLGAAVRGRTMAIVGGVLLAYSIAEGVFGVASNDRQTLDEWQANNPRCQVGQICAITFDDGPFLVVPTAEKSSSASGWSYYGRYPYIKNESLGAASAPYAYRVYWKVPPGDLYEIVNPKPRVDDNNPATKRQVPRVPPGGLSEYLKQFADKEPDKTGLTQTINDMLDEFYNGPDAAGVKPGLRAIMDDVARAIAGVGTKIRDFFQDSPADRDPLQVTDPTTGSPVPDPGTDTTPLPGTPNPSPGTGTGTGTGSGGCAPGSPDCPAKVDWGAPPTGAPPTEPTPFAWVPTPWNAPDLPGSCSGVPYDFSSVLRGAAGSINPCPALDQARPVVRPVAVLGWTTYAISQFLDL